MTIPTPEHAADPTPEALELAKRLRTHANCRLGWDQWIEFAMLDSDAARAIDAFAQAAVEKERERATRAAKAMEAGYFRRLHHLVQFIEYGAEPTGDMP